MPTSSNGLLLSLLILLFISSSQFVSSSPVYKQSSSFHRPDPTNHFKAYHGGYDILNRHYWASALFTGVHGYAVAGIWILGGLGIGIYVIKKNRDESFSPLEENSDLYYFLPFMAVVLCTFVILMASGFIFVASLKSMVRAQKLEHTVLRAAKEARRSIRNVTQTMHEMQGLLRPYNAMAYYQLKNASMKLQKESTVIKQQVSKHHSLVDKAIKIWYGTTVGIVSINMILATAALAFLLLHWRPGFIMIIILCWILTALCWIYTGFQFFLHTFAEDTCSAFKDYNENPRNSSVNTLLPCVNEEGANSFMVQIGSSIYNFVNKLNSQITKLSPFIQHNTQKNDLVDEFGLICNPFTGPPNFTYKGTGCPDNTIPIKEFPNVLETFTCYEESSTCKTKMKFISEDSYNMALAYSQATQHLLNIYPELQNLTACTLVKETLSEVLLQDCSPLQASLKMLWLSMIALSVTMVVLELAWISKAYQDKGRSFVLFSLIPIRDTSMPIRGNVEII